MGDYGDNISRISDLIKQSQQAPLSGIDENESSLFSQAVGKANKKAQEYTDKWDTIKEKGDEELAGVLGIEVPLKGYKKAKGLYKKYKDAKEQLEKKRNPEKQEEEEDPQGFGEAEEEEATIDSGGGGASVGADVGREVQTQENYWVGDMKQRLQGTRELPDSSSAVDRNAVTDEPLTIEDGGSEILDSGVSRIGDFADRVKAVGSDALETLKSGLGKVGDVIGSAKNKLLGSSGDLIAKKVGEDEAVGVFDSVVGGIPLLGEGALAITGLISLGRAFAHLFKHKKHFTPKTPQLQGIALPQVNTELTQKYSMGLPSIDSASEVSASFSAF